MNFFQRLKLAWKVFKLTPVDFEIQLKPFHRTGFVRPGIDCDNSRRVNNCKNKATIFMEETVLKISVREENSYLLCDDCAKFAEGTTEKLEWKIEK